MPHIKKGAQKDFLEIVGNELYSTVKWNKTENQFHVGNSIIEFFSLDAPHKARGARRDWLFVNECNAISYELYQQLEVRTRDKIFLDFNPSSRFWAHELIGKEGVSFDISTYIDNPYLDINIIKSIEAQREINPEWWQVYGLGQIGQLQGAIIPKFNLVDEMPDIDTDCGLDFGFTNDPSCFLETGISGGQIYINELFYERYLTNQDIIRKFEQLNVDSRQYIIADSAEPKSIEEIYRAGYNIVPCIKGEDSFKYGVDLIKQYPINITKNSVNVIKDFRNATWDKDKEGNYINKARKGFLHAIDAARYSLNRLAAPPTAPKAGWIRGV